MTIYTLPEPFETKVGNTEKPVVVVAYDSETEHFWFGRSNDWHCGSAIVGFFNPPPPIPAAARKPNVGEVWVTNLGSVYLLVGRDSVFWRTVSRGGACPILGDDVVNFIRPATPEEAEPFRDLLNGLQAALGEGK